MDSSLQPKLAEIEAAIAGLSEQELRAAAPDKWSIAEILEHLSITYVTSMKGVMSKVLAAGPRASRPRLKQRVTTFLVTGIGYFPQGRQAPEFTLPKGRATSDVLADIRSALPEMDTALAECERRYGSRLKIADHPILGPLTAPQWRNFHCVHTRHHLKQIVARRKTLGERRAAAAADQ